MISYLQDHPRWIILYLYFGLLFAVWIINHEYTSPTARRVQKYTPTVRWFGTIIAAFAIGLVWLPFIAVVLIWFVYPTRKKK